MKPLIVLALATVSLQAEIVNFDNATAGQLLTGWTGTKTGDGKPMWTVEKDETAPSRPNVLKQSGEADYPVAVKDDTSLKDGFVEVKFKPVAGKEDQAAGIVWRYQDAGNYYIARANALEGNVRIYYFVNGKRTQFKGVKIDVPTGQWQSLRVDFSGDASKVTFNGKQLFDATDSTIKAAGKVGVWTKADSVTLFDDFAYGAK